MLRVLVILSLLGALSCKTSNRASGLNSAVWMNGDEAKLIYFDKGTFILNTCSVSNELKESVRTKKSVEDAKRICNSYSTLVTPASLKTALTDSLLGPAKSSIGATKTQRIADIVNQVIDLNTHLERLESGLQGFTEEEAAVIAPDTIAEINSLKKELKTLGSESAALKEASNNPEKLKAIDINATLALQSKIASNAVEQANLLSDMLADAKLYVLDVNRDVTLIAALSNFPATCANGMNAGEKKTVISGIEKLDVQCEKNGKLTVLNTSCTMSGYEVLNVSGNQKSCIFTGNLKLGSLTATNDGICGLTSNAKLSCWGKIGQFPLNIDLNSKTDSLNSKNSVLTGLVSSSEQVCSMDAGNRIAECWPSNPAPNRNQAFSSVVNGNAHMCGLSDSSDPICWAQSNLVQSSGPMNAKGAKQVSAFNQVTCVIDSGDRVKCWGKYAENEAVDPSQVPATVLESIALSVGPRNICALNPEKKVTCWGNPTGLREVPANLSDVRMILTGNYEACAITKNGDLRCWGEGQKVQSYRSAPDLKNVSNIFVSKSGSNFCAVHDSDKKLSCWGSERFNTDYKFVPPSDLKNVKTVAITASGYACALTEFGELRCFGNTSDIPDAPKKL